MDKRVRLRVLNLILVGLFNTVIGRRNKSTKLLIYIEKDFLLILIIAYSIQKYKLIFITINL